ncbi:MAG: hypothetical protein FI703_03935 [SAR202 cluster bacterium]|mgnify:CR=1 FL=1|jgi:hypothetical protein|nr:hypothetical protein [SAR202 cluster bacterium]|tara:strand:+ start:3120 stop:3311 length:192 start_codon:yes stop_codon:yes gene_type:complete
MYPLIVPLHHEAPGDPTLMEWIKERMDSVIGLEAEAMVVIFGLMVLVIPLGILVAYRLQRPRD